MCPTGDSNEMRKQAFILCLLGMAFIKRSYGYSLDHHHHPHPSPAPQYAVPPPAPPTPSIAPLCGCNVKGRCDESLRAFTDLVIRTKASELVCGSQTELCCYKDDPWPGITDSFAHLAPCVPDNVCVRHYGISPTDVRDYGAIGPCPGLGAVRCLDHIAPAGPAFPIQPEGPTHFVFPILEYPPPDFQHSVVVVHNPPPPDTEPPPTNTPPTPPTGYDIPTPSTEYDIPEPPVAYLPPQPAPEPEPPVAYLPPQPLPEPEPPISPPPTPSQVYTPPPPPYPSTSYGVPDLPQGQPYGYAYTSRFGYPYAYSRYGGYYPGFRFRLRKYFGGGFLG